MLRRRGQRGSARLQAAVASAELSEGDIGDGGLIVVDTAGELIHYAPATVTSQVRYAVSRIVGSSKGGIPERVSITSAVEGEGVSFVSQTLAAILANDMRRKVCLVELNWWSASHHAERVTAAAERREHDIGVAQVIAGTATLEEAWVRTMNPALTILPAGKASLAERHVLAKSPALAELMDVLATKFDHLVFDLPPVLTASEAAVLVGLAEAFILVVRQGSTAEHKVRLALHELRHLVALGVVLNRTSTRVPRRISELLSA